MSALSQESPLDNILAKVQDVAVLPQVVFKVIDLIGNPDVSVADIERIVTVDPGFCARVLQLVNSAYYCLPKQVGSIREAVMFIGFTSLRQLATMIGAFDLFMGKADKASLRRRLWWRHSIDAAVSCRQMAKLRSDVSSDEAYAAALLHDIGKSILDRYDTSKYDKVESLVERGALVSDAEKAVFGADHCEAGAAATEHWRFPAFFVECARCQDEPAAEMEYPELSALVAAASGFADLYESRADTRPLDVVPSWAAMVLGLNETAAQEAFEQCCAAIDEVTSLAGVM